MNPCWTMLLALGLGGCDEPCQTTVQVVLREGHEALGEVFCPHGTATHLLHEGRDLYLLCVCPGATVPIHDADGGTRSVP